MPPARAAQRQPWPAAQELLGGLSRLAESLLTPRGAADELDEARELLAYWEQRARRLPRWAVMRRREARAMAWRWRERVRTAEQTRYGAGLLGAASQLAVERRMPTTVAHRGRQAVRVVGYAALTAAFTLALVAAATVARTVPAALSSGRPTSTRRVARARDLGGRRANPHALVASIASTPRASGAAGAG